ncbi:hypothetical protein [Clostridium senegalense]|uniref:Uncharacterized protein n=1 Tax=Clostridium senegalense TaxID=1465809 RepID=A0A6M0H4K7_9CLOT|nr:hypothetical protein [Clostridium senegalense]NEU04811.1 hypothetical protein [Clostridium senegalense]
MVRKSKNNKSAVKIALAITGVAATSIFLYEKFVQNRDNKIRQCFDRYEENFDDDYLEDCDCGDSINENYATITVEKDNEGCSGCECTENSCEDLNIDDSYNNVENLNSENEVNTSSEENTNNKNKDTDSI